MKRSFDRALLDPPFSPAAATAADLFSAGSNDSFSQFRISSVEMSSAVQ